MRLFILFTLLSIQAGIAMYVYFGTNCGSDFRIWWIYEKIGSAVEIHDQLQDGSDFQEKVDSQWD